MLLIAGQSASWLSPVLHVQDGKYLTKALKDIPLVKSVRERLHAAWSELPLQVQEAPAYQDLRAFTIARFPGWRLPKEGAETHFPATTPTFPCPSCLFGLHGVLNRITPWFFPLDEVSVLES